MAALPPDLRSALDEELGKYPQTRLTQSVERLSSRYRENSPATAPILSSEVDIAAYAGYRMPATYAAIHAVLAEAAFRAPGFAPRTQIDVGGGTGAAIWAAADVWPSLEDSTVVEQVPGAIALGRRLAGNAAVKAVRGSTWQRGLIDPDAPAPDADLVTLSYVLGELPGPRRADVVGWLAAKAGMLVLIEPGTPAGYERIVEARDRLVELGLFLVAPCPHEGACPIPRGKDWCHFSARLPRTGLHRQLKAGTLGFEDEKFSYVVASRTAPERAAGRILRHPVKRKGMVSLSLCAEAGLTETIVTKRHGADYRAARDAEWGGAWPPTQSTVD
ncbi:small ribosomal subunit Rsm22 family protein [Amycolatopsis regifaucium]|uniref:rRNA methyltransferase n=1 Tax=Amycolatopsis regifaucium TaxID=546365 RepID=A0A154MTA7_9PSEU|nr:small ribosomal subunit Rsm22 family protein [Amycolatopsis regifaucium]KZB87163.1 rRNA methyltransferase [Amycolatopsis regifaucium]OKA07993.1 rRNA methyltransferase [Amycolatopsis regifaucium]SFI35630.1 Ribosomal protein RSM22 (predicted rRNA methylase) [Amycolatopsis regifaucium]